jgi:hypothetical protein
MPLLSTAATLLFIITTWIHRKAAVLYTHLKLAIGSELKPKDITKGQAFFWGEERVGERVRIFVCGAISLSPSGSRW